MQDYCDRWGILLTVEDSAALIDEVDRWCRRTGTNYNKLAVTACVAATVRHKVRARVKGGRLTPKVAIRLRATMEQYPHGISRDEYRAKFKPWGFRPISPTPKQPERVIRETCGRCGAISGRCEHSVLSAYREPVGVRV